MQLCWKLHWISDMLTVPHRIPIHGKNRDGYYKIKAIDFRFHF